MKVSLIFILFICSACTYKPQLLVNSNDKSDERTCFIRGEEIPDRQKMYYKIKNEFAEYPGEEKLRFYYDLSEFISNNKKQCKKTKWVIQNIVSEKLFFSDTGKIKNGVSLQIDVVFITDGNHTQRQKFQIRKVGDFQSGFSATKKSTAKDILGLLKDAFQELNSQAVIFDKKIN